MPSLYSSILPTRFYLTFSRHGQQLLPSDLDVSFDVDTLSAGFTDSNFITDAGTECLNEFLFTLLAATNINAYADGVQVWHANSGQAGIFGAKAGSGCAGAVSGAVAVTDGTTLFNSNVDFPVDITKNQFTSTNDPMGLVVNDQKYSGLTSYTAPGVELTMSGTGRSVSAPEPDTLVLLAAGAIGLAATYKRRRHVATR